ncbi:MAG: heterodisulfide reductase-related iron-sulfur binding cluster [Thermoleophilia bacterium]
MEWAKGFESAWEEALPESVSGSPQRVTWHDPCHLRWGLGISAEPREIIAGLPGVEYVESAEGSACCGGEGLDIRDAYSGAAGGLLLTCNVKEAEETCKNECWRSSSRWVKTSSARS